MSLKIIRAGLLDTLQDAGRQGHMHQGINPGGVMDHLSARLANALLGKDSLAPVFEFHFPAPEILFNQPTIIALCGGDFHPTINGQDIPMNHPVMVAGGSLLRFTHLDMGARCYLGLYHDLDLEPWLGSYSTHSKSGMGGWMGRALKKDDEINYRNTSVLPDRIKKEFRVLPWKAHDTVPFIPEVSFLIGSEWYELTQESQENFQQHYFQIRLDSDRMGYRLNGQKMEVREAEEMVSAGVSFGTVQLLPDGHLIILMADHQTTGGYPRIAHIISAHLPILAQKKPNDVLQFRMTDIGTAEEKWIKTEKYLDDIQNACKFRMDSLLY